MWPSFIAFWVLSGQPWRHKRVLQPPTRPPKTPKVSFLLMFNNSFEYKYTKRVYTRTISRNRGYEKSRGNLNKPTGLARQLQTTFFAVLSSPEQDSQQHGANLSKQLYTTQQHFDTAQRHLKTARKNSGGSSGVALSSSDTSQNSKPPSSSTQLWAALNSSETFQNRSNQLSLQFSFFLPSQNRSNTVLFN